MRVMLREVHGPIDALGDLVRRHRAGEPVGITSVCSAHPLVLEATMLDAAPRGGPVLVEATSNQVDQTGGYTGMRPPDFRELVLATAQRCGVTADRVLLGGDHLGPNRWRELPAAEAMDRADALVAAYAQAGFTKLHLDCSMACADDPEPVGDDRASARAARLMRVAHDVASDPRTLSYVIGTEVPVPGGAAEAIGELAPTTARAARATLRAHRDAVAAVGLDEAWSQVRALVVQPGVEFDEWSVADYAPHGTTELQRVLDDEPEMVFEAHSTDYQTPAALAHLVRDHWAVLKVGPGLTFALREALFALAAIEDALCEPAARSRLLDVLEQRMTARPEQWERHHRGGDRALALARRYSYSDRSRYYWPDPAVHAAQERLLENLEAVEIPLPLLSQHLPLEYALVRAGALPREPRALVLDHIGAVLRDYRRACVTAERPEA
jgi:D-tagatose-1,6-bisphosphate aldolase subunit GatZ/KbaZ